jgi:putative transposase
MRARFEVALRNSLRSEDLSYRFAEGAGRSDTVGYYLVMSRLRRIEKFDRIFFVTTNLANGQKSLGPDERDLVLAVIGEQHRIGSFWLFGYVIMPDHLHLLLSPNSHDLPMLMRNIKSLSGFRVRKTRGCSGPLWQARYFDNIIRQVKNFWEKLEYIHRNPVEAGLASDAGGWRWSSHWAWQRGSNCDVPVDPIDLPSDREALLWPGK